MQKHQRRGISVGSSFIKKKNSLLLVRECILVYKLKEESQPKEHKGPETVFWCAVILKTTVDVDLTRLKQSILK